MCNHNNQRIYQLIICNHDKQGEAKIFEDHAVGTYKDSRLIGHVQIELFSVLHIYQEEK